MPFVEVTDGRLYYKSHGSGRSMVLMHGAWASHAWWQWQISELCAAYRVFSYDARGHGKSTALRDVFSMAGFTNDLKILLQHFQIDETALIGWSMGGMIAMQFCLDHPTRVKALILIATSGHRIPGLKLRFYSLYLQALLSLLMDFAQPRKYDRSAQQFPRQNLWLEHQVRNMLSPMTSKEVFDWVLADIRDTPRENFFTVIKSLWDWEAGDELRRINVPTLILVGENDTLVPPRFSRMLHDTIPNSRLIMIKNAGHYLVLERPQLVNAEILKFLKSIGY